MAQSLERFVDVAALRVGMYIHLDVGWMDHPFPLNHFKISSAEQIETIRRMGLRRVRHVPEKSDPEVSAGAAPETAVAEVAAAGGQLESANQSAEALERQARAEALAAQRASLKRCEREYEETAKAYRQITDGATSRPEASRELAEVVVGKIVDALLAQQESSIRLLSERVGERGSLHAVNVTVLSLLLGKACRLDVGALADIGVAALLHDIGKLELADRLRWRDEKSSAAEVQAYQTHVAHGVALGKKMKLSPGALLAICQHHEHADGSGFPKRCSGEQLVPAARVVALVNQYDELCNPVNPASGQTPHEALALIFAQRRARFDTAILGTFIRMMGVYPPGSVIELADGRHAMVVSVNSSRPLKPRIIIHEPSVPAEQALIVDLEHTPELSIRRSVKPLQLAKPVYEYLSPRRRTCYFFEPSTELPRKDGGA